MKDYHVFNNAANDLVCVKANSPIAAVKSICGSDVKRVSKDEMNIDFIVSELYKSDKRFYYNKVA